MHDEAGREVPGVVVGALPVQSGRVLLSRSMAEPGRAGWAWFATSLELGESAQEAARRAVEAASPLRVEVGRLLGVYSRPHLRTVVIAYEANVVGDPESGAASDDVRAFGPDEIPWSELASDVTESALRDWLAGLPGRGPRFVPELYVEGDPE